MSVPFTKIEPESLTRFTHDDEGALEQIFRVEYDALVELATAEAEDAAVAPRLVEEAFYEAWQRRQQFVSPGDLEYFLRQTIHKLALREKGRRAAMQRFHEHEGHAAQPHAAPAAAPLTVDQAWAQLAAVLHAPPPNTEEVAHRRHDHSRHEAASHVAHIADRQRSPIGVGLLAVVGVVVIVGIIALVRWLMPGDPIAAANSALASSESRVVSTRPGLRANVELADGTQTVLGPDTQLRIPPTFGDRSRAVGVVGTAAFTVAPGQDRAFLVRARNATVTATGTAFAVSAYPNEPVVVRVSEGTVTVTAGGLVRSLAAGEAVMVDADSVVSDAPAALVEEMTGWTDGVFVATAVPIGDLPALLQRWYGMQVLVEDSSVLARPVTLRVPLDSSRQLIDAIEAQGRVRYARRGENRVFRDADQ